MAAITNVRIVRSHLEGFRSELNNVLKNAYEISQQNKEIVLTGVLRYRGIWEKNIFFRVVQEVPLPTHSKPRNPPCQTPVYTERVNKIEK
jgi:hypothetical protein